MWEAYSRIAFSTSSRSKYYASRGVVKDVLVFLGHLVFPCDFVVVFMPEDTCAPITLGRSCLATARTIIDVKGKITLELGEDKMVFELPKPMANASTEKYQSVHELNEWAFEVGDYGCCTEEKHNGNNLSLKVRSNNANVFGRAYKGHWYLLMLIW